MGALFFYALQYSDFQTDMSQKAANWLSEKLGSKVTVGNVQISWLDEVRLEDVNIKDLQGRDMIYVREVYVNCKTNFTLRGDRVINFDNNLDFVMLKEPDVKLIREEDGTLNIDAWIKKAASLKAKRDTLSPRVTKPFTIDEAVIQNGTFQLSDAYKDRYPDELFDYSNFQIKNITGNVKDFFIHRDTITFHGTNIKGLEPRSNLAIKGIDTDFFYSKKQILLQNLEAKINNSVIKDFIGMYYDKPSDLNRFNTEVRLKANLKNSVFDSQDLGRLATTMYSYNENYRVDANLTGLVSDLYFENAKVGFGEQSYLAGKGHFKGFPDVKNAFYHMEVSPSFINAPDAKQYAGEGNYKEYVEKFGKVNFEGLFKGTFVDFFTDAKINSSNLGLVNGKLLYEIEPVTKLPTYNTDIVQSRVSLGKLTGNDKLKDISFKGKLIGAGYSIDNASFDMDGLIDQIWFNNYNFRNIKVNGLLRQSVFDGNVVVNDPNLSASVKGRVDFNPEQNQFRINGQIDKSNLMPLGFTDEPIQLITEFNFDFDGNKLDNWLGQAAFKNTFVNREDRNLVIDDLTFLSKNDKNQRMMGIRTEYFDGDISGEFVPSVLLADLMELQKEYGLFFSGTADERERYYKTKVKDSLKLDYAAHYAVDVKDTKDFFAFFNPEVSVNEGMQVSGDIKIQSTSQVSLYTTVDTLIYKGNTFYNNELDFYSSKSAFSPDVLTSLILSSEEQKLSSEVETENLQLNGSWGGSKKISFDGGIRQKDSKNRALLFGDLSFLKNGFAISINPRNSFVDLLDFKWGFDKENQITVFGSEIQFEDFRVSNKEQSLALSGFVSEDSTKQLFAAINQFDLRALEPLAALRIEGVADGDVSISNYYRNPILLSNVVVSELVYKDILVGDVNAVIDWDRFLGKVKIDSKIEREGVKILDVAGTYDPNSDNGMNLTADLDNANLIILGTFVDNIFSDLGGYANGELSITGRPRDPIIRGDVKIEDGQLKINSTGSYLYFSDIIKFTEEGFVADKGGFKVYDAKNNGNEAYLEGGIFNGGGGNFMMGLHAYIKDSDGFRLLNTGVNDNDAFYGNAFASGDIHLTGDFSDILITGNLVSKPRSKVTIPLDGAASVDTEVEAIPFATNPNEEQEDGEKKKVINRNLNGVRVSFNLTVTPEAEVEILMDRSNNDKINAFGNARLSFDYDSRNNDFTMSGPYEVVSGKYDFSFQNLASLRKFEILEGSRISWSGDPYNAILAIKASYQTNIDMSGIWSTETTDSEVDNTRYPVNVTVNITDDLQAPNIGYEINFEENQIPSRHQTDLLAFEQRLRDNEQLLSRNVSSVIAFNKLFPENNIRDAFDQQFLIDNINSMLSNQIGNLASKLDPNLEVGVLLGDFRQNLLNNMQLNFSYKFLNNRAKLSGKSSYSNGLDNATTFSATQGQLSVGGELEYLLSEDGIWKLKVHSRSVPNSNYSFLNATTGNVTVSGASILFSRNFNSFFNKKPNKIPIGVGKKEEEGDVDVVPEISFAD
ncbi:hypothetical protein DJ013_06205 [Arcticibacterium luteifluviistationis]|uniref:Translocation and assembly module TamB C-terminal domain-containing protein n=2 Tax=Arcticibacterium luteifluviistationis TaxID=1784714 RepID=A0A2Z4G989_9BACT|nr:hypothetical protein DJ013_06205 [Arcticibacterium luteifluviistationis]